MDRNIALLSRHNSYIGREFAGSLINKGINFVFVQFGDYGVIDKEEESRTGGKWLPPLIEHDKKGCKVVRYKKLDSRCIDELVSEYGITFAIQGDVGSIISKDVIDLFSDGIVNFHPGDLPDYRGCSAPEWQILEKKSVICTCHYLDEGIDTGDIICKQQLNINLESYEGMRSSVYPVISKFMVSVVVDYLKIGRLSGSKQYGGQYRKYIGDEKIEFIKKQLCVRNKVC